MSNTATPVSHSTRTDVSPNKCVVDDDYDEDDDDNDNEDDEEEGDVFEDG